MPFRSVIFQNLYFFIPAITVAVVGCSSKDASFRGSSLRIQIHSEPISLDPARAEDGLSLKILSNLMEGLMVYDGRGKLTPGLAESYRISSDGRRIEFKLRPQLEWSDGVTVTPQHFVDGIRRSISEGSKFAPFLKPIQKVFSESGKLIIVLWRPTPFFIHALTLPAALPIRLDRLDPKNGILPEDAPVTGAYRIESHARDQKLILKSNSRYWEGSSKIQTVEIQIVHDESAAMNLFEKGELDIVTRVPALEMGNLRKSGHLRIDPYYATYYLAFNTRKPPFNDRVWRHAVSGAIQRDQLVKALGTGEIPARRWVPPGLWGTVEDPVASLPNDVFVAMEKIRRLPARRKNIPAHFDSGSRNAWVMEKIQADLKAALGIRLTLSTFDWKTYVRSLQTDPPELFRFAWLAPIADPISHLQVFTSDSPNNYTGWKNERYDRIVREIEVMPSGVARDRKIHEAQEILIDREAAIAPLFHYVQSHAVSQRVKHFRVNPFGVITFKELALDPGD